MSILFNGRLEQLITNIVHSSAQWQTKRNKKLLYLEKGIGGVPENECHFIAPDT